MTHKYRLILVIIPFLPSFSVKAQPWPSSLHVLSAPCWKELDTDGGKKRFAGVMGTIYTDDYRWIHLTIAGRIVIRQPSGETTEFKPIGSFTDVRTGKPNAFQFGIDRGALAAEEEVLSCDATFVSGTRITRKPAEVSLTDTPIAKDEGCLRDLAAALQTDGLVRRKLLAELIEYKCVEVAPADYVVTEAKPRSVKTSTGPLPAILVFLERPYSETTTSTLRAFYSGLTLPSFIGQGTTLLLEDVPGRSKPQ